MKILTSIFLLIFVSFNCYAENETLTITEVLEMVKAQERLEKKVQSISKTLGQIDPSMLSKIDPSLTAGIKKFVNK